jgi:hypothetical protein
MIVWNGHEDLFGTNIHPGGMRSHHWHAPLPLFVSFRHMILLE